MVADIDGVNEGERDGVAVFEGLAERVGDIVTVLDGVDVNVVDGVFERVTDGVCVAEEETDGVGVNEAERDGVNVFVGVIDGVCVLELVLDGVAVLDGVRVDVREQEAGTVSPRVLQPPQGQGIAAADASGQ